MSSSQRGAWKRTSVANRRMVWLTAIVAFATLFLVVASFFQYLTAREQSKAAIEQAEAAKTQASIMADQTQAVKDSAQAAKDSAASAKTQADASTIQANVSEQMAKQNDRLVGAAETQADASLIQARTAQVSAQAAAKSADIAFQSYTAGERPQVFFTVARLTAPLAVGTSPTFQYKITNTGKTAYSLGIEVNYAFHPKSFAGPLKYQVRSAEPVYVPLATDAEEFGAIRFDRFEVTTEKLKLVDDQAYLFFVYGRIAYEDSTKREHTVSFCFLYDREVSGSLKYCPARYEAK